MKRVVFAVPGSLDTPTGGYAYDRRIMAELRHLGWEVDYLNIGDGFPAADEVTRAAARSLLAAIPAGRPIVLDGLALGVLPDVAAELASRASPGRAGASPIGARIRIDRRACRLPSLQRTGGPRRSARSRGDEPGISEACRLGLRRAAQPHHGCKAWKRSCAAAISTAAKRRTSSPVGRLGGAAQGVRYPRPRSARCSLTSRGG